MIDGDALRAARRQRGLTQRGLVAECAQLGTEIDPGNLHRAETGQSGAIGIDKLPGVARALGIDDMARILTDHGRKIAAEKAGQPA